MNTLFSLPKQSARQIFAPKSRFIGAVAGIILSAVLAFQANAQQPAPASSNDVQLPANAGPNLALNKSHVCSDPNVSGWDKGLTDGSWEESESHTFATGLSDQLPKTVTLDLEKPAEISLVLLGVPVFGSTKTISISVSADGTKFTDVGYYVFSQNKTEKHLYTFAPTLARYVKLTYPDRYDSPAGIYSIKHVFTTELEVYAPSK